MPEPSQYSYVDITSALIEPEVTESPLSTYFLLNKTQPMVNIKLRAEETITAKLVDVVIGAQAGSCFVIPPYTSKQ